MITRAVFQSGFCQLNSQSRYTEQWKEFVKKRALRNTSYQRVLFKSRADARRLGNSATIPVPRSTIRNGCHASGRTAIPGGEARGPVWRSDQPWPLGRYVLRARRTGSARADGLGGRSA